MAMTPGDPFTGNLTAKIDASGLAKDTSVQAVHTALGSPAQDATVTAVKTTLGAPAQDATVTAVKTTLGAPAQDGSVTALPGSIATTGVPLLAKATQLFDRNNTVAAGGQSATFGPFAVNQLGYNLYAVANETVAGGNGGPLGIQMSWVDSTSGQVVDVQNWWVVPGSLGNNSIFNGYGPVRGDQLFFTLFNRNAVSVHNELIVSLNSRVYTRDVLETYNNAPNSGGWTIPNDVDVPALLLGNATVSLANNGRATYLLPLYSGQVKVHWDTSSGAADGTLFISPVTDDTSGTPLFRLQTGAASPAVGPGNGNEYLILPRAQCTLGLINGNASTQTLRWIMTGEPS